MHYVQFFQQQTWRKRACRLGLLAGCLALGAGMLLPAKDKKSEPAVVDPQMDSNHPTLILEGFNAQVTRDGLPRQTVAAEWAQMDEAEHFLTLRRVQSRFFAKGELQGEARCGYAQTWLRDRPEENIHRNDMRLSDKVFYQMKQGWMLQTAQMNYSSRNETLVSDQPYVKQLPMKNGFLIGKGDGFTIKLDKAQNTFVNWQEYGKPAVLLHSDIPELQP